MQYAPTLLPENTVRFLFPTRTRSTSPASVEVLIFFCLLFLYQDKKRRWRQDEYVPPNTILMMVNAQNVIRFRVIHSIDGTFVGRMQYAPTVLPENA